MQGIKRRKERRLRKKFNLNLKGENDGFEAALGDDGDIIKTLKLLKHFKKLCSES